MTAQLSRERLEALANIQSLECMALPASHAESAEMARMLLAGMDSKPVAWTDEQELRDLEKSGCAYLFTVNPITPNADPRRVIKLYTAPPAPVMPVELHPDTQKLVADFCAALAEKLYKAQLKYGYDADWKQDGWPSQCQAHFHQHIAKGDPRDVAAYCAFMWYHGWKTEPAPVADDYFASLVTQARARADKAMHKFPQPNYVLNKVAEESGEVIKAVIHYTEGREEWQNVEGEIIDNLAMLIRLVQEGDQVIGFTPPTDCRAAMLKQTCTCPSGDGSLRWPCPDHPPEPLRTSTVPDGWKLVPVDATRAMIDAARRVEEDGYDAMHKAMLAAAPAAPEQEV